jgi:cobalt-zinc-cadmium efflux system outer membrane protein
MKSLRVGLAPTCLCTLLMAAPALAESLTLGQALQRAATANQSLAAQAAESESVSARAARGALAPPLIFGAEIENVGGNGQLRGFDAAETTVSVSRVLELGNKRAGRRALGEIEIARAGNALANARLDVRILATHRFVEVVADQERLALAQERERVAERLRQEVERVVRNARNPETDLRAAELALADAELEREHAEHELRAARVTLAATWGQREPDFDTVSMALLNLPAAETLDALAAKLPASASLRGAALDVDAAVARVTLADRETRPDVNVSLGVRRLQAFDDHGLIMGISVPLGTGPRARHAISESRALSAAVTHRRAALESESYQQLFERYQEMGHARTEFDLLTGTMIPKAEQAQVLAQRGFDAGRFSFVVLSQSQATLFELRRRRIDAALRYHQFFAETQRLVAAAEAP